MTHCYAPTYHPFPSSFAATNNLFLLFLLFFIAILLVFVLAFIVIVLMSSSSSFVFPFPHHHQRGFCLASPFLYCYFPLVVFFIVIVLGIVLILVLVLLFPLRATLPKFFFPVSLINYFPRFYPHHFALLIVLFALLRPSIFVPLRTAMTPCFSSWQPFHYSLAFSSARLLVVLYISHVPSFLILINTNLPY